MKAHKDKVMDMVPPPQAEVMELESGIKAEADGKIRDIEAAAEAFVTRRMRDAHKQAESILSEARAAAEARASAFLTATESGLAVERTRQRLLTEEKLMQRILDMSAGEFCRNCAQGDHHDRLLTWLCEASATIAAATVASDEADVQGTVEDAEFLTGDLLKEAEVRLKELTGRRVSLRFSEKPPLEGRGLVLTAEGGRIACDNRAKARIARAEKTLRSFIREELELELEGYPSSTPGQPPATDGLATLGRATPGGAAISRETLGRENAASAPTGEA